jgi:hypothetical protein
MKSGMKELSVGALLEVGCLVVSIADSFAPSEIEKHAGP